MKINPYWSFNKRHEEWSRQNREKLRPTYDRLVYVYNVLHLRTVCRVCLYIVHYTLYIPFMWLVSFSENCDASRHSESTDTYCSHCGQTLYENGGTDFPAEESP